MRKVLLYLSAVIILTCGIFINYFMQENGAKADFITYTDSVADDILRFHIIANSDTQADQRLKLKVRDIVAESVANDLKREGINSKAEAMAYVSLHLNTYIEEAKSVIRDNGYNYAVSADIKKSWFPVKIYGRYIFPEGEYDALKLMIGKAEGKNWWCVLFPSLCVVDEAYQVMPDEGGISQETAECGRTEMSGHGDTGTETQANEDAEVKIKFRFIEWIKDMW